MKRICLVALAALAGLAAAPDSARAGAPCGLPDTRPVWVDFADGSVPFWHVFARPGIVGAASNFIYPPQLRAGGAKTVYFDLYLNNRVGTPSKPADPAVVVDRANRLFYRAVASSDCATPWIALNELFGSHTTTPWSPTNAQYRANVLTFIRTLAARGARPFLLLSTRPYTGGEAGDWWREVAKIADLVREVYFTAPKIHAQGPVAGSRTLRNAFRRAIFDLTEIGIPAWRVGVMLGFQTTPGRGGRSGLRPATAWFRHVKLLTLAARQVASEIRMGSAWSWGWAAWSDPERDPDKEAAACIWLWARNQELCNGPAAGGPDFNADLTEGQISLPRGVRCAVGARTITQGEITRLAALTGDREIALTALFARLALAERVPLKAKALRAAERSIVSYRFGGSWSIYRAALARAGAAPAVARGIIADELRQAEIERRFRVRSPSGSEIADYYETYSSVQARLVEARPAPWWLGGLRRGVAIGSLAPAQVFSIAPGRRVPVRTRDGAYKVRAFGRPLPLGAFSLAGARPSIRAALVEIARREAFERWAPTEQEKALDHTRCTRDDLPVVGAIDLTTYAPFLALTM